MNSKAVLISIRPKWVDKIMNGQKILEVRKTKPKLDLPFKCYIYQSGKNLLKAVYGSEFSKNDFVVGEFTCDRIEEYKYSDCGGCDIDDETLLETMLEWDEINIYANGKSIFCWHISDLKIYDEPKELSDFGLKRSPQSWQYVEEL